MSETEQITKTKERLEKHRSLGVLQRIGRRAIGNYPVKSEREALRRHELGPDGRIVEDVVQAVGWSKGLNRTPTAVLNGGWVTGDSMHSTIPAPIGEGDKLKAQLNMLLGANGRSSAASFDGIGFALPSYSKRLTDEMNATDNDKVVMYAFRDFSVIDAVTIPRERILAMDSQAQDALEAAARLVSSNAYTTYMHSRPENVG